LILIIGFYLLVSGLRPFYCPVELRFCVRPHSDIGVQFRPIFAIDNINPFKHLVLLSKQLSSIRLQKDYLLQCEKNNALIDELSKEIKALVIVQSELKNDRERFIKKDKFLSSPIEKIDLELELLKNQKSIIIENMDLLDFKLGF
ncbi:hypothetical protein PJV92_03665, partial [Aliarcobacter butzleri]